MTSTDRLIDLGTKSIALGAFIIAYVRWVPSRMAELLNSPTYIGYLISLQFGLMVIVVFSVAYVLTYLGEMQEEIEGEIDQSVNYYLSELAPFDPESLDAPSEDVDADEEEIEDVATDGGSESVDGNGDDLSDRDRILEINPGTSGSSPRTGPERTDGKVRGDGHDTGWRTAFTERVRGRVDTTGRGMLIGVFVGIPLGLLYSLDTTVLGGVLGAVLGNEIEYQARRSRRAFDPLDTDDTLPPDVAPDALYALLKNRRRRQVIRILGDADGAVSIDELAGRIAALENDKDESRLTDQERKRVYVPLYQAHLPKMDEEGVIRYHQATGTVEEGELFDEMTRMQDALTDPHALPDGMSRDVLYALLQSQRRRRVLRILAGEDATLTLGDLAERIAAWENDKTVPEVTAAERKRVYVGLYQAHLPKMDEAGVVRFDRNRGEVEQGPLFDDLFGRAEDGSVARLATPLLSARAISTSSETAYYLAISTLAMAVYAISQQGLLPVTAERVNALFLVYAVLVAIPPIYRLTQ